jgi:glycosyltransferase involved in cell wall biosynthesis
VSLDGDAGRRGPGAPPAVLVVGWFPSPSDVAAGRFVADQAAAVAASGRYDVSMAAFEHVPLFGDDALRSATDAAHERAMVIANDRGGWPFAPRGAAGPPGLPVARLGVGAGPVPGLGADHAAVHRERALHRIASRPERPDWRLVHAHVGYPEGAAAATLATELGTPLVLTEHASYLRDLLAEHDQRRRYVAAVAQADRFLAVSQMLADEVAAELADELPGLSAKTLVVPNVVDTNLFQLAPPDERRPGELLWVGNRRATKGIATLLRAFRVVLAERPQTSLRLVGGSSSAAEEARWRSLAAELGVAEAVTFEEAAGRDEVVAAMGRAAVFVHPSPRETFGVVAAEALAAGLPVVAVDSGGVAEILGATPERFGAIVPRGRGPDDQAVAAALGDAIVATLDRRETFDPAVLRAHVVDRYSAETVAASIAGVYDEILAAAPAPARRSEDRPRPSVATPVATRPRRIIVGVHRSVLERYLAAIPDWVIEDVHVVTTGPPDVAGRPARSAGPDAAARVAELLRFGARSAPGGGRWTTARRAVTGRVRRILARQRRHPLEQQVLQETRVALEAVVAEGAGAETQVVCLTGLDHLVAEPLIAAGALRPMTGALSRLADVVATERGDVPISGA